MSGESGRAISGDQCSLIHRMSAGRMSAFAARKAARPALAQSSDGTSTGELALHSDFAEDRLHSSRHQRKRRKIETRHASTTTYLTEQPENSNAQRSKQNHVALAYESNTATGYENESDQFDGGDDGSDVVSDDEEADASSKKPVTGDLASQQLSTFSSTTSNVLAESERDWTVKLSRKDVSTLHNTISIQSPEVPA